MSTTRTPLTARLLFDGTLESEIAPWATGNVFAPHVRRQGTDWRMWYGGQGRDGHDRIHLAESRDGVAWSNRRVVLEHPADNLINDPFVVESGAGYAMYYTVAPQWIIDRIHLAYSADGERWEPQGEVIGPGPAGAWDSLLVGRPSVLREAGRTRMWYDGRRVLPPGLGRGYAPEGLPALRQVGYAEAADGRSFTRPIAQPVFGTQHGSVHVSVYGGTYVMLHESRRGTLIALSRDGQRWRDAGILIEAGGELDRYGHVTPFVAYGDDGRPARVYMGLARGRAWTENSVGMAELDGELDRLIEGAKWQD